ncbi:hypothetical protein A2643_03565 [Candidatus Nomurabacteria bacterium RIFCSPHIGHO2_01_FULL_39_220]|uniref:Capsule synthesis protein CapA domain-containing protein n=1 Tax=Candidatus Nomurabacteria bacterium RIFCSPLOWO2_02_FULL_40_67 TaxID=1801787 RepID=A0A1F6Y2U4_9BACT|nr:MAG: hypothetical protein UU01_C0016G0006 [Parcubacteria group bacterium GW2011_GWA2_40_37]KKS10855.1 MAG: hypothetical protein UU66_C0039G0005 [Parcubacteria group bacterium GW2011_GWB1_41_5]OGI62868.1 MAG: hypothetical protein A2W12_02920 [Candidatus Nomurabacteria bacterium RBG_16_40_11]OGI69390.1 MAG: hypothetical protein A2643_03565 [Candidatus Nomurabacteria bacterium RIFCSPHIGHO2_01_FULL_39_220]OGI72736.1 MAG: hypothetical protein A2W56_02865 [Candidatus Nomurabacteria bacterium RIFCS
MKLKTTLRTVFWVTIALAIGIFLASLAFFSLENFNFRKINQSQNTVLGIESLTGGGEELSGINQSNRPKYFYLNSINTEPKVSAKAYLVGDLNTGEVILSKNQDKKFPIASVSKLMTALVTHLIAPKEDLAVVSKTALSTKGTNGELLLGEKIKTSDLLYPLLLESSNDAAEVLAEHFTRESFIQKMNQEAEKLKMADTSFDDPSGLSIQNQSTVSDIFKLTGYLAKETPEVLQITTKRSYSNKKHSWSNISQFLGDEGYQGGKSGYTDPAKQTVVSIFNLPLGKEGLRPIAITLLQSSDREKDVEGILKYLKRNIYYGGATDANTNWIQEKIGVPDIKEPNFVTLVFGGDIMLDRGVRSSVVKNFNNDYSALFAKKDLSDILKKSDIVFANLEGTASDKGADLKNLYSFRMDPAVVPALKGAGISILSVANNHIGDWGRNAYIDTLSRLRENEIHYTGGGMNSAEAETPAIIEKYGMKIGFLGFSDVGPTAMEADVDQAGQLLANDPRFDEIIQNASKQVDYLVVSFHFGDEYKTKHNARQEYLAHKAVDAGAKLIIGSHPHVIEDTEIYKNSFIAYSLGNFIFDQSWSAPTMQGMLLEVKLNRDGSMTVKKDTIHLNSAFQPETIIKGTEEKIKFQEIKNNATQ